LRATLCGKNCKIDAVPDFSLTPVAPVEAQAAEFLLHLAQLEFRYIPILEDVRDLAEEALQEVEPAHMAAEEMPLHQVGISRADLLVSPLVLRLICLATQPVFHLTPPRPAPGRTWDSRCGSPWGSPAPVSGRHGSRNCRARDRAPTGPAASGQSALTGRTRRTGSADRRRTADGLTPDAVHGA